MPMLCLSDMQRLLLLLSLAIALVAMAIPATSGAKVHHGKGHKARVADRNHNGMPDSWERKFRVHKATADPDHDGVQNLGEFHNGTSPRDADTDNDGVDDGNDDANHDGIDDADEQSGTIKSFDGTKLIVTLVNGDELSGTVTDQTEIECDTPSPAPAAATTRHDDGGSDDGPGDDHGTDETPAAPTTTPGTQPPSDDDPSDDQGDDHGDDSASCGKDALTPGTIVREAELNLTSTGAIFHKIELGGKAPA